MSPRICITSLLFLRLSQSSKPVSSLFCLSYHQRGKSPSFCSLKTLPHEVACPFLTISPSIHHSGNLPYIVFVTYSAARYKKKNQFHFQATPASSPAVLRYDVGAASLIMALVGPIILLSARTGSLNCRGQCEMKLYGALFKRY